MPAKLKFKVSFSAGSVGLPNGKTLEVVDGVVKVDAADAVYLSDSPQFTPINDAPVPTTKEEKEAAKDTTAAKK